MRHELRISASVNWLREKERGGGGWFKWFTFSADLVTRGHGTGD